MEIRGIPANIDPSKLEETVINISKKIDIDIKSEDMEACHRLRRKGNTNSVIIRFVNRKFTKRLQASKKKLKDASFNDIEGCDSGTNIFFSENLCPYYF